MSDKDQQTGMLPGNRAATSPSSASAPPTAAIQELSIGYPYGLPYQILAPVQAPAANTNPFSLNTKTVNGVGSAVSVVLGAAVPGTPNAWTVIEASASVATQGAQTDYRLGSAQFTVVTNGTTVQLVGAVALGPEVNVFSGDAGKIIPSVSIVGGQVLLTFTPLGDPALTIFYGVTGLVANALGS